MNDPIAISATRIVKSFNGTRAVDDATVEVAHGQVVALLGPSGSGKTTLLRVIAGFEVPDAGTVSIGGRMVAGNGTWIEPDRRRVGMVFQDGALFPHLTVADNVGFGKPRQGRIEECLQLVGLADRSRSYPHELSGGERQRVALARALATEPEVVLLDEPFASLDAALRSTLREEVAAILRAAGASALLVTHDQQEALSLADTVVLMRDGCVEQVGSPEEVYAAPATRWAAEFLGAVDVVPGTTADGVVTCELGRFPVDDTVAGGAVDVWCAPRPSSSVPTPTAMPTSGRRRHRLRPRPWSVEPSTAPTSSCGSSWRAGSACRSRLPGFAAWSPGDRVKVWVEGPVQVLAREPR